MLNAMDVNLDVNEFSHLNGKLYSFAFSIFSCFFFQVQCILIMLEQHSMLVVS